MTIAVTLLSMKDTATLGFILAKIYGAELLPPPLLLQGEPGAGKTTLARCLVENLPGGRPEDGVEVSSPSFTLCNAYACSPPVLHFDLYRLEENSANEDFEEAVGLAEEGTLLLLVEWPERIIKNSLPQKFILLELSGRGQERQAAFSGWNAPGFLEKLAELAQGENLPVIFTDIRIEK
ncbi:MAG: tRNA (adenosine(37)-N6)-threonylcarbamoyltransferase complex ATPase subunit type 1 TsaE [Deltaproteobacteria bacterium]|jgi:tRNA threonylcarbamoyladenosine biosynthesis protein TsaE|nr:tRNA (adenosine(37)-N6)-threonylcarbamoyltransferase complex ATPase subunit type 1 TsaE [Deltaproteobacteria bacterium]